MVLKRLFIGNLPEKLTNDELASKFSTFGNVQDAEVKTKNEATFGFISLFVEEDKNVKQCIDVLNNTKWRGSLIKVQLAKESFMDKLKREQAENKERANRPPGIISFEDEPENSVNNNMGKLMTNYYKDVAQGKVTSLLPHLGAEKKKEVKEESIVVAKDESVNSRLLSISISSKKLLPSSPIKSTNLNFKNDSPKSIQQKNNSKSKVVESSDSDDSDMEVSEQGLPRFRGIMAYPELTAPVEKKLEPEFKKPKVDISNNNHQNHQPIGQRLLQVVESSKVPVKEFTPLNFKKRNSDQIRQKSMEDRLNLTQNRFYQMAMIKNSLSNLEPPPAIKATISVDEPVTKKKKNKLSQNLFDDDGTTEDVEKSFKIKPQFEGESGQKNFEFSSRFAAYDSRFVIDERFKDEQEHDENDDGTANLEQEKLSSLSILSDVLGTTVAPKLKNNSTKKSSVIIQRYDPDNDNEEDDPSEIQNSESNSTFKNKTKSTIKEGQEKVTEEPKEATYYVASNLKELLTSNTTSFSLLDTFGTPNGHRNNSIQNDNDATTTISKKGKGENSFWQKKNPFKYDSSDSEEEDETKKVPTSNGHQETGPKKKLPKKERFFFSNKDIRFEGVTDFFLKETEDMNDVLYRFNNGERSELKLICKSKVKNTKRKSDKRIETLRRLKRKKKEQNRKKVTLEGSNAVPVGAK